MSKMTIAMLSVGALLLAALPVAAWQGPGGKQDAIDGARGGKRFGRRGRHGRRGRGGLMRNPEMMKAHLGLSDGQVQQIKSILDGARARTATQQKQIKPLRQQLKTLMQAKSIDASQIYAVHSQIRSLRQVIADEQFKARLQVLQLLTVEQRGKMMQRKGGRGKGFGKGAGKGWRWGGQKAAQ